MRDVVFVLVLVAFFAVAVGLVWVCERIVGGGEAVPLRSGAERAERGGGMIGSVTRYDNAIGLILAVLVAAYLVYALVAPEKL